jgi:type IV pilus assembly protein PilA
MNPGNTNCRYGIKPQVQAPKDSEGFSLIELLIVVAVVAIIMTLAIPTWTNYSIRSKLSTAYTHTEGAKAAVSSTCLKNSGIPELSSKLAGYKFKPSKYVKNIVLAGSCEAPVITMTTKATGAKPQPVLTITGKLLDSSGQMSWTCVSSSLNIHAPEPCRS